MHDLHLKFPNEQMGGVTAHFFDLVIPPITFEKALLEEFKSAMLS